MFGITNDMLYKFFIRAVVLFTAMPVHECAHGLVADRLGDDTPRVQGRLTLNPFAHLDWTGTILLFFTGFGWAKPVSVDMRNFKHPRRDMALTALAGPASNITIAFLVLVIYRFLPFFTAMRMTPAISALSEILGSVIVINVSLAVFNFLPVPPLDGSKIFGAVLPEKLYHGMLRYQRQISIALMLLLFSGILTIPLTWLSSRAVDFLLFITSPINLLYR